MAQFSQQIVIDIDVDIEGLQEAVARAERSIGELAGAMEALSQVEADPKVNLLTAGAWADLITLRTALAATPAAVIPIRLDIDDRLENLAFRMTEMAEEGGELAESAKKATGALSRLGIPTDELQTFGNILRDIGGGDGGGPGGALGFIARGGGPAARAFGLLAAKIGAATAALGGFVTAGALVIQVLGGISQIIGGIGGTLGGGLSFLVASIGGAVGKAEQLRDRFDEINSLGGGFRTLVNAAGRELLDATTGLRGSGGVALFEEMADAALMVVEAVSDTIGMFIDVSGTSDDMLGSFRRVADVLQTNLPLIMEQFSLFLQDSMPMIERMLTSLIRMMPGLLSFFGTLSRDSEGIGKSLMLIGGIVGDLMITFSRLAAILTPITNLVLFIIKVITGSIKALANFTSNVARFWGDLAEATAEVLDNLLGITDIMGNPRTDQGEGSFANWWRSGDNNPFAPRTDLSGGLLRDDMGPLSPDDIEPGGFAVMNGDVIQGDNVESQDNSVNVGADTEAMLSRIVQDAIEETNSFARRSQGAQ